MKNKINQLIAGNKLDDALDLLIEIIEYQDKEVFNTLILLKSRNTSNEMDNIAGIVGRDEYLRTKAQITNSVMQTMDRLNDNILSSTPLNKETKGYQEILDLLIDKKIAFENELTTTYDTEKKFALKLQIKELESKIIEIKQKLSGTNNSSFNINVNKTYSSDNSKKEDKTIKSKILFLAANPTDQARVQTDKEYNAIRQRLGASSQRDTYDLLMPEFALNIENLVKAMNQKPAIIHFSGHGEKEGILITNAVNESQPLPSAALLRLFKQHKDSTNLVVLNACHSAEQAKTISGLGFYVIGTNTAFSDEAAVSFATGLYIGLGEGKPVEQAYDDAMIVLMTNYAEDFTIPEIWKDGNKLDI